MKASPRSMFFFMFMFFRLHSRGGTQFFDIDCFTAFENICILYTSRKLKLRGQPFYFWDRTVVKLFWDVDSKFGYCEMCYNQKLCLKELCHEILKKLRHGKWSSKSVKYKNNHLKQWKNISIAQQIQKKVRMAKSEEDWDGLWYGFMKYSRLLGWTGFNMQYL